MQIDWIPTGLTASIRCFPESGVFRFKYWYFQAFADEWAEDTESLFPSYQTLERFKW
jgi:hypothetical protein